MPSSAKPEPSNLLGQPFPIEFVDECDSTNRVLGDRVRANQWGPVLLVARRQTAGKGRLGRTWEAPAGSAFTGSWLVPLDRSGWNEFPWLLSIAVALGVGDYLAELRLAEQVLLKWPNDIMTVGKRKLCGILAEFVSAPTCGPSAVVVGAGLNVVRPEVVEGVLAERGAWVSELLTEQVAGSQPVDGAATDPRLQVERVANALNRHVSRWVNENGPAQVMSEYRTQCSTIGQFVRVEQLDTTWEGIATDVCDDGGLLVTDLDGAQRKVNAADVVHLRPVSRPLTEPVEALSTIQTND